MMESIKGWFHTETPEEAMKKYKRSLDRTVKDLDRERTKLVQQEKKITIEMKKMAKQDQIDSVRIMAKDLVRTRKFAQKMYRMKTQIQGVSLRIQTMQATNQMAKAMAGVGKAMGKMNAKMNIPQMQAIMREFEKQNEMMGMKEEMMNDAVDDIMDDDDLEEEETELEINKVMDEIGLEFKSKVGVTDAELPQKGSKQDETVDEEEDKELMSKYAALKQSMK
jgi:charged multivesicular body protein 2A